jgi:hypothetical protein
MSLHDDDWPHIAPTTDTERERVAVNERRIASARAALDERHGSCVRVDPDPRDTQRRVEPEREGDPGTA